MTDQSVYSIHVGFHLSADPATSAVDRFPGNSRIVTESLRLTKQALFAHRRRYLRHRDLRTLTSPMQDEGMEARLDWCCGRAMVRLGRHVVPANEKGLQPCNSEYGAKVLRF